ncbi:MAG: sulfatase [Planctomycetota bacterium]
MIKLMLPSALTLILAFITCSVNAAAPPNVIIFIADDVSWDDFGCYGSKNAKTPNIDRIVNDGIQFNNFYLTASSCSPSRNSIMTGRYPHNTGAAELHTQPPESMLSLPELLRKEGYHTVLAGKHHLGKYAARGFDEEYRKKTINGDGGEERWEQTIEERPTDKPFFFWFATHDSHRGWGENKFSGTHDPEELIVPPYLADSIETRKDLAAYYDEVHRFDHYIGKGVAKLKSEGIYENTILIIMADNGRPFPHSKTRVNDRGMKSPFIVIWPKGISRPGSECNALVSAIDIAPTLLKLAGAETPDQFQGIPFDQLFADPSKAARSYLFAEHNWHDFEAHERMLRSEHFMYILNSRPQLANHGAGDVLGSPSSADLFRLDDADELNDLQRDLFIAPRPAHELYDLRVDKAQHNNVASIPEYQDELAEMQSVLQQWMSVTGDSVPKNLTRDWRSRTVPRRNTEYRDIRGEMPGAINNATEINAKGPF